MVMNIVVGEGYMKFGCITQLYMFESSYNEKWGGENNSE